MAAFLAAFVALAMDPPAPLEIQAKDALRMAQRHVQSGERLRGLATLDSLLFSNGVTVALEKPSPIASAVAYGLDTWNEALGEKTFTFCNRREGADVIVRFVPVIEDRGGDVQGMVRASRELKWSDRTCSYRLQAMILIGDRIDGRAIQADEVATVVAHESGHLLGLADVNREDRLMGPLVVGHIQRGPASDEIQAVRDYRASIRNSYPKPVDKR